MSNTKQIQINASPEQAKGAYANLMQINHTQEEFILDFFMVLPPNGHLVSRIVMSPGHLKRTIQVLQNQLKSFEVKHGDITQSEEPPKPSIGYGSH